MRDHSGDVFEFARVQGPKNKLFFTIVCGRRNQSSECNGADNRVPCKLGIPAKFFLTGSFGSCDVGGAFGNNNLNI